MVSLANQTPIMAILEALTFNECRFRSLASIDVGETVEFELPLGNYEKAKLRGTIFATTTAGPRNIYRLEFVKSSREVDAQLAQLLGDITPASQATNAPVKAPKRNAPAAPLTRSSVRVPVEIGVGYAHEDGGFGTGRTSNISEGGVHVVCEAEFGVGSTLELTFVLPDGDARETVLNARIVARQRASAAFAYNLAFFGLDADSHARIAKFVEAHRS